MIAEFGEEVAGVWLEKMGRMGGLPSAAMSNSASWGIVGFLCVWISAGRLQAFRLPYVTKETRHGLSRMRVLI